MTLTDAQLVKLRNGRKSLPPDYYSADLDEQDNIGTSTEDALILLGSDTKNEAIQYLKAFISAQESALTQDYNDLLQEFSAQQVANSTAADSDLQQLTGKFNTFRNKFRADMDDKYDPLIYDGMQPILKAMTTTASRMSEIDRYETYHRTFDSIVDAQFHQSVTANLKRELRSWVRVIASYP